MFGSLTPKKRTFRLTSTHYGRSTMVHVAPHLIDDLPGAFVQLRITTAQRGAILTALIGDHIERVVPNWQGLPVMEALEWWAPTPADVSYWMMNTPLFNEVTA